MKNQMRQNMATGAIAKGMEDITRGMGDIQRGMGDIAKSMMARDQYH